MRPLHLLLFLAFSVNGVTMLGWPQWWYLHLPGVAETGPFNAHFVRDIGAAYLVAGLTFGALLQRIEGARPAAFASCGFLLIHAGIHLVEALAGIHPIAHFLRDVPAVLALPLLALWSLRPFHAATAHSTSQRGAHG